MKLNVNGQAYEFENGMNALDIADQLGKDVKKNALAAKLDGEVISAPTVNSVIAGGQGQITGDFTADEAKNLATLILSGALQTGERLPSVRDFRRACVSASWHRECVRSHRCRLPAQSVVSRCGCECLKTFH